MLGGVFWIAGGLLFSQESNPDAERIQWQLREQQFYVSLASKLKAQLPKLPSLLAADPPRQSDADAMKAHLRMLVDQADKSRVLPKPMFLLLADRLAMMLGYSWDPRSPPLDRNFNAGSFTIAYRYDQLGATWVYDRALARYVYQTYPDTPAGEWAFLTLEKLGWNTGVACPTGPDLFRAVITESGRFFNRHRNSPYRIDFLFDLAQAYETWWALSQAPKDDDYVVAADYAPGSDAARTRAIELFKQIAREAPKSEFGTYATLMLPRLQSKLDTGQRQYYCIYD
jgi:hypothetical protein